MMRKILLGCCLLGSFFGYAQQKAASLDSLFTNLHREGKFYGNVLIAEKGVPVYEKSFGLADEQTKRPLDKETVFELASVSKQFTAMGIMMLQKAGKLNYDDSLGKFIPELPYHHISIRNLLNHTSGLPDYMALFDLAWDLKRIATNKDMIEQLIQYKPAILFQPGMKYEYSNTGYALLASVIEKVSGMPYSDFLQKNIFKPLKMTRTRVYRRRYENKAMDNYALGYVKDKKLGFVLPDSLADYRNMVYCLDGIVGDGTVNSTTGDLLKWDRALYSNSLINQELLAEAFKPVKLGNGKTSKYGFGWSIDSIGLFGNIVNHSGSWPGYNTFIERHLTNDKTIIILKNHEVDGFYLSKIRNILYDIKIVTGAEATLDEETLKKYIGKYELAPGFVISITVSKGKIYAQATGQQMFEIFPEKDNKDLFFVKVVDAKIKFSRDEKGMVNSLTLLQNGQEIPGPKIE
jgi:CubicO group peptidase (beta-lactamase class C family)